MSIVCAFLFDDTTLMRYDLTLTTGCLGVPGGFDSVDFSFTLYYIGGHYIIHTSKL